MGDKPKVSCDFIILIPGSDFSREFLGCWSQTLITLLEKKYKFFFINSYSSIVQDVRNRQLTSSVLNYKHPDTYVTELFNNEIESCKKVIFIDSDMTWEISEILKLIESPYPITVAPYSRPDELINIGYEETPPVGLRHKSFLNDKTEPFEVDFAGLGFAAIEYEVLTKLKFPYFDTKYTLQVDNRYHLLGEDTYFFRKIREAGYKIMCDPSLRPGHLKLHNYI
jgi:hypothetical protein